MPVLNLYAFRHRYKIAVRWIVLGAATTAGALLVFSAAAPTANPKPRPSAAVARQAKVYLSPDGQASLAPLIGADCVNRAVTVLYTTNAAGNSTAVVLPAKDCKPLQVDLEPSWGLIIDCGPDPAQCW